MAPLQRSNSVSQPDNLQIQHFMHQHLLHKLYMTSEFNCDGCNTGGSGVRFRCSDCDFDIHEQCATSCHRISSHLHPHHQLVLINRPGDSHICHVCKGVTNGLSYTCEIQSCEFNVHTLCIQIPVPGGVSTTALAGYNNQPVLINQQQMQGTPTTVFGGYNGVINSQPVMVNQQQQIQGIHTMQLGGYNGVNTSQPVTVNHQQKQGIVTTAFGGYHGVNNHQPVMVNQQQQQQQGTGFGGYNGGHNSQPVVMVNHQQQKQGVQTTAYGGYQGMNNNQTHQMIHHHQQQMIPTATGFGGYQGGMMNTQPVMVNHHQQLQQQQQLMMNSQPVGGYNLVNNNNQSVMFNHPPPAGQQSTASNGYSKVGKFAANILSTSLIGIPIFNSRK